MNKVVIIVSEDHKTELKDCPICKLAFSNKEDVINFRIYGCCKACDIKYREPNREKWEEGWRPNN